MKCQAHWQHAREYNPLARFWDSLSPSLSLSLLDANTQIQADAMYTYPHILIRGIYSDSDTRIGMHAHT